MLLGDVGIQPHVGPLLDIGLPYKLTISRPIIYTSDHRLCITNKVGFPMVLCAKEYFHRPSPIVKKYQWTSAVLTVTFPMMTNTSETVLPIIGKLILWNFTLKYGPLLLHIHITIYLYLSIHSSNIYFSRCLSPASYCFQHCINDTCTKLNKWFKANTLTLN